jgi:hypothetical protein
MSDLSNDIKKHTTKSRETIPLIQSKIKENFIILKKLYSSEVEEKKSWFWSKKEPEPEPSGTN